MPSWTLATVQPARELTIARRLTSHEFPIFLPKVVARVCLRGRVVDRLRPAFPRYLWLDALGRYHELRTVFGVVDFLKTGPIVDLAVNGLMAVTDQNGVLPIPEATSRFTRGDPVRIRGNGLLAGHAAVFDRMLDGGKAIVMVDWFGRPCPTPVLMDDLLAEPKLEVKPAKRRRHRRGHRKGRNANAPDLTRQT